MNIVDKRCHFCGGKLPADTEKRSDPYAEEIGGDRTEYYICDDCYYESCMDI